MRLFAAAALVVALSFPPAYAAPAACVYTLEPTIQQLTEQKVKFLVLDAKQREQFLADFIPAYQAKTGEKPAFLDRITNVIFAVIEDELLFGLEYDGCLTGPAALSEFLPNLPPEKRSGLTPAGIFA